MNWDDFRFFQAVKKTQTLKGAGQILGTDQATVGRRLYALEDSLGTKLFEKRSNGYFLTQAGERVTRSIDRVEEEFDGVNRKIAGDEQRLEGTIRIAAPGALANHLLIPGLKAFLQKNPGIVIQFLTGPEVVNLAKREADLAIRFVRPNQQNLQVKKIGTVSLNLYATKPFLKEYGTPKKSEDLARIPFVGLVDDAMSDVEEKFLATAKPYLNYVLKSHAWTSIYQAVQAGIGYGVLPDFMTNRDRTLEQIEIFDPVVAPIWLVIHSDLKSNARVRALLEELNRLF